MNGGLLPEPNTTNSGGIFNDPQYNGQYPTRKNPPVKLFTVVLFLMFLILILTLPSCTTIIPVAKDLGRAIFPPDTVYKPIPCPCPCDTAIKVQK